MKERIEKEELDPRRGGPGAKSLERVKKDSNADQNQLTLPEGEISSIIKSQITQ
jgi:hypothetical protein